MDADDLGEKGPDGQPKEKSSGGPRKLLICVIGKFYISMLPCGEKSLFYCLIICIIHLEHNTKNY